jgi:hypothetical protein
VDEQLNLLYQRIVLGAQSTGEFVPRILEDPRAYPREVMLLAVAAALLLLLIVMAVYLTLDYIKYREERRRIGVRATHAKTFARWAVISIALGSLLLVMGVAPALPSVARECTNCHAIEAQVAAWAEGPHATVACYGCHARPGVAGALEASLVEVARMIRPSEEETSSAVRSARLFNASCLECHAGIREGVVGDMVLMRHSDVLEAGMVCERCHPGVGHESAETAGRVVESTMDTCLTCHDGTVASADCEVCHTHAPLDSATEVAGTANPTMTTCDGCHSPATEKACIDCHGLELPHPAGFMSTHAGRANNEPALCGRCHEGLTATSGCVCHGGQENLHGTYEVWFPAHGPAASSTGAGGCNCHEVRFCGYCHPSDPFGRR